MDPVKSAGEKTYTHCSVPLFQLLVVLKAILYGAIPPSYMQWCLDRHFRDKAVIPGSKVLNEKLVDLHFLFLCFLFLFFCEWKMLLKCHLDNFHLQLRKQVSKHARKLTASCRKYDNFSHLCPPQEKKKNVKLLVIQWRHRSKWESFNPLCALQMFPITFSYHICLNQSPDF